MKKLLVLAAAAIAGCMSVSAEVATSLFLIGEPAGGWDTSKGIEMTKTSDGVFEIDVELPGTQSFGFVKSLNSSGDWTAFNSCRYTPAERGQVPVIGDNEMLYTGDDSNDYSWDLGAGKYHFTVNTNTMKFILSADGELPPAPAVDLYFTGEVNNWSFPEEYKLSVDGNVYTYTTGVIRGGLPFKISANNWNPAYTSKNEQMLPGNVYDVTTGDGLANMAFAEDVEDAVLILDTEARTLTVKGTTGIDDVAADAENAPAEYFNLQGVRVAEPAAGLYLVRRAGKVEKVLVK